jgi:catechol 2,3-dioxygenase-like lactoylglutathione lyase family enzyme
MLTDAKLVAFGATTDGARAARFYRDVLGLRMRYEDDFAVSLDSGGIELRLQKVERFTPQSFTTLGWQVARVLDVLQQLARHGVTPERYPWLDQDAAGVWEAPSGARVAWFKDPDGNLLSVAEYPPVGEQRDAQSAGR